MLNTNLNLDEYAQAFAADGRVRIADILEEDAAVAITTCLRDAVNYYLVMYARDQAQRLAPNELGSKPEAEQQALYDELMQNASRGVGYLYEGYHLDPVAMTPPPELAPLDEFARWLNSEPALAAIARISGRDDLRRADAQCTRYAPGHFLTRHSDSIEGETRRLAYVFSFCPQWHPDWGGLLQFFQPDGSPREAWTPGFNTLSLFDVSHIHSVTYVAPFAAQPRLSVTGWFRAE